VSEPAARDTAFAAIALLRCRDRLPALIETITEPRRIELARAVAQHERFDEAHLRQILGRVIRAEHTAVRDTVARVAGDAVGRVPRVVRIWLAQETEQ
jgi:hypothetical protein